MSIESIFARQIFDSRGNPTLEVDLVTNKGQFRAAVPSGATTGAHEAVELRDGGKAYMGKGVTKAVANVNQTIAPALIKAKIAITDQKAIDNFLINLDGTENKTKLGANAILGVSLAVSKAGAAEAGVPLYAYYAQLAGNSAPYVLPTIACNVLNGGNHAGNRLAFQEFMIVPTGAQSFTEAMQIATEVYHNLKMVIKSKYGIDATNVGDEGGFAPNVQSADEALDLLVAAIEQAGYKGKVHISIDVASDEFFKDGKYDLDFKNPKGSDSSKWLDGKQLAEIYAGYIKRYPIISIEDPFHEDDWQAWSQFRQTAGITVVADDLTVTNPVRIQKAIREKCCDGLLLKINQIGTITETIQAVHLAQNDGWAIKVSHRSGETEDTSIADLTVGIGAGLMKSGALARSERVAKYNQLLRIEHLEPNSTYAGLDGFTINNKPPKVLQTIKKA